MKKFITIFLCVFMCGSFFGQQTTECGFVGDSLPDPLGHYSYSTNPQDLVPVSPKVYNIKFWIIKKDDGTGNTFVTEQKMLEGIANLNIALNQFNIFFKYRGYDTLNSSEYIVWEDPGDFKDLLNYAKLTGKNYPNSFNVYVPREAGGFGGIAEAYISTNLGVPAVNVTRATFSHEIGHCLDLIHVDGDYFPCENVTRDPFNSDFNATTAGDMVVDTPATRNLNSSDVSQNCFYVGNYTDCSVIPEQYQISEMDIRNFLMRVSPTTFFACNKTNFTIGQGIRMREAIEFDEIMSLDILSEAETSIASLYEPYAGGYYGTGSTALPLFQPGFDYRFIACDCDCAQPSPYGDPFSLDVSVQDIVVSKYETDYSTIFHPNHTAIIINSFQDPINQNPQRCYDNDNGFFNRGSVIRFNDGVFNGNVTITHKDSTGINNTMLIEELPNGLYSIEKNYLDGSVDQTVIQKGNN